MNSREKDIYLELLRAALWEREVDISVFVGEWKWEVLLGAFRKHDLLGVVANIIILLPEKVKPSMQEMALVYNYLGSLIQSHRQLNRRLEEVMPKLEAVGCKPILLKGQGLSGLYPKTCVRACGDLDIYVGAEKIEDAKGVVNAMATKEELEEATGDDSTRHYHITINDIIYELHLTAGDAANKKYASEYESIATQQIKSGKNAKVSLSVSAEENIEIEVPPLDFNVWYLLNHLVEHMCDAGVGMRQFCDWLMVVRKLGNSSNLESHLEKTLKAVGLLRAWKILGGVLVYQLGLPKEDFPLFDERLAKKSQGFIVEDMLNGARFRFAPLEEMRDKQGHGIKHLLYNIHFYYYMSRPLFVLSPWAPYINCGKFMLGGFKHSIKMLINKMK